MVTQNPPNFVFALSLALINQGPINYSTLEGIKLWRGAIEPLAKELFTLEPHRFKLFLSTLTKQTMVYGWENILNIPIDTAVQAGPTHSLLTHYRQVMLQQVKDHATTYLNTQTRAAQNNLLLYTCLATSIAPETKTKAMIFHQDYHEGQTPMDAAYLKILIQEANVDTRSTVMHIRAKLSALNSYILTIGCDITKFNAYIKDLIDSLMTRGETNNDLLTNLFKAYKAVSDQEFVSYICKKEDKYEEGVEINTDALMLLADNKFKTFRQAQIWNAPSLEEEKILALETQIQKLRKERKKPKQQEGTKKDKDKDGTKKGKKKKKRDGPKWMQVPPADADKDKPKTVKGKQYFWCAKHTKWAGHITSACQGKGLKDPKNNQQKPLPSLQTMAHLGLTRALSALKSSDSE